MDALLSKVFGTAENMQKLASLGGDGEDGVPAEAELVAEAAREKIASWNQKLAAETGRAVDFTALTDEQKAELLDAAIEEIFQDVADEEGDVSASEEQVTEALHKLAIAETFGRTWGDIMFQSDVAALADYNEPSLSKFAMDSGAVGRTARLLQKFAETPPVAPAAEAAKAPPLARLKAWFNSLPSWAKASIVGGAGLGVGLGAGIPIGRATARKK